MSIFRRFGKLLAADIHGMLDLMEDPVDVCKQAIREMEEEIGALRTSIQGKKTRIERLAEQRARVEAKQREAEEQLAICIKSADDGLARGALRRKLEQEKLLRLIEQQRQGAAGDEARESRQLAEYEARLTSVREKLACFTEQRASRDGVIGEAGEPLSVSEEEIELALIQAKTNAQGEKRI